MTLTGPFTVSDDKSTATCPATASLAPTASITCTATYTVTQADLDSGSVTNVASATDGTVTSPTDTLTITGTQSPGLTIAKTSPDTSYAAAGDVLHYSYLVTNSGNVTLTGPFTVSDDKTTVTCPATASLAPATSITCTATYSVTQADVDSGTVTNTATATARFAYPDSETPTTVTSPADQLTIAVEQDAALTVAKSSTTTLVSVAGQVVHYTYLVTNTGNVTLTGIGLSDNNTDGTLTCPATTLAPDATMTCSASHLVTQADLDAGGTLDNTVTATSEQRAHAADTLRIRIAQIPGIVVTKKTTAVHFSAVGQAIAYTVTATNTGNITLDPVTISDPGIDTFTCTPAHGPLAPGATMTCTGVHHITQADLDGGKYTNTATAVGYYGEKDAFVSALSDPVVVTLQAAPPPTDAMSQVFGGGGTVIAGGVALTVLTFGVSSSSSSRSAGVAAARHSRLLVGSARSSSRGHGPSTTSVPTIPYASWPGRWQMYRYVPGVANVTVVVRVVPAGIVTSVGRARGPAPSPSVALVDRGVADDPLVVDRVVVAEHDRDRDAGRDAHRGRS